MPTAATPDAATLRRWVDTGLITAEAAESVAGPKRLGEPRPRSAGRVVLEFDVPILPAVECNVGGTLAGKLARKAAVKRAVAGAVAGFVLPGGGLALTPPAVVTITRHGRRPLDSDNLANSLKVVRDMVAADILRTDDGSPLIDWRYTQAKTRGAGFVRVRIETVPTETAA